MFGMISIGLIIFIVILVLAIILVLIIKLIAGSGKKQELNVAINLSEQLRERELELKRLEERNMSQVIEQKYFCPNCGAVQESDAKFCGNCGAKLDKRS